eukprot:scaffold1605_cov158-Amphora_coffeaeformis.AAC.8
MDPKFAVLCLALEELKSSSRSASSVGSGSAVQGPRPKTNSKHPFLNTAAIIRNSTAITPVPQSQTIINEIELEPNQAHHFPTPNRKRGIYHSSTPKALQQQQRSPSGESDDDEDAKLAKKIKKAFTSPTNRQRESIEITEIQNDKYHDPQPFTDSYFPEDLWQVAPLKDELLCCGDDDDLLWDDSEIESVILNHRNEATTTSTAMEDRRNPGNTIDKRDPFNAFVETGHPEGMKIFYEQRTFYPVEQEQQQRMDRPDTLAGPQAGAVPRDGDSTREPCDCPHKKDNILLRMRQEHEKNTPRCGKKEKHFEHAFIEFGELLKVAETTEQFCTSSSALDKEWKRLLQDARRFQLKSPADSAKEIVESRQKRRKLKYNGASSTKIPADDLSKNYTIEPYHIVLGDHSTKNRTFGTLVLRYFCLLTKYMGPDELDQVLPRTRNLLQDAFPSARADQVGRILYMNGKTASRFAPRSQDSSQQLYSFGRGEDSDDNKATFVPVARDHELGVVKHLYTKMTPSSERSLRELAVAYRRMLLDHSVMVQQPALQVKVGSFQRLLDFCETAEILDLTQTAINGLRESLDSKWAELQVACETLCV